MDLTSNDQFTPSHNLGLESRFWAGLFKYKTKVRYFNFLNMIRMDNTAKMGWSTGFPEPFGQSNTTWPHPQADLSPNPILWQEDLQRRQLTLRLHLLAKLKARKFKLLSEGSSASRIIPGDFYISKKRVISRFDGNALKAFDQSGPLELEKSDDPEGPPIIWRKWIIMRPTQGDVAILATPLGCFWCCWGGWAKCHHRGRPSRGWTICLWYYSTGWYSSLWCYRSLMST